MKQVLVIAYYFPPLGGAGVQRTLKFIKYLPEFGWEPLVLSVSPKGICLLDHSQVAEIPKNIQICRTNKWLVPLKLPWRMRNFISRWLLLVDEQIGWMPFAIRQGQRIIRTEDIQAIYSTSAPYTGHLIARKLKHQFGLPWVADFRDAWVGNFGVTPPSELHNSLTRRLEKQVLLSADRVTVVSEPIRTGMLQRIPALPAGKVVTLPNGYDPADLWGLPQSHNTQSEQFTITHNGTFYAKHRTPDSFLRALHKLLNEGLIPSSKIRVNFIGNSSRDVLRLISEYNLAGVVQTTGYIDHRVSIGILMKSDLLLLVVGSGPGSEAVLTGKIFEYLAVQKPILALAPEGAASRLIRETNTGVVEDPDSIPAISEQLLQLYQSWASGKLEIHPNLPAIQSYDRRSLTQKLSVILEEIHGISR